MFLNCFDVLISKIIFLKIKKKYYFDVFLRKKHSEKQSLPHFQTPLNHEFSASHHNYKGRVYLAQGGDCGSGESTTMF